MKKGKIYTSPLTDDDRDELWAEILAIPNEKIDFLLSIGTEEFKIHNQSRITLRNRVQTLMIILLTATTGSLLSILYGTTDIWRRITLLVPAITWLFSSGVLFFYVQSRKFWTGFGSPLDNIDSSESLSDAKIRKLFNIEESIISMSMNNYKIGRVFNGCLIASALGITTGLSIGVFSVFILPLF